MNNQDPEVTPEILSIPCVKLTQHNQNIFLFSLDANTLWNILEINERSSDKDEGYQRALSNSRAEDISNFIIQRGIISPALIVSLNKSSFDEATSTLQIPKIDNAGWVIDGQHRLRGAYLASIVENSPVNLTLPVIAFSDLSEDEQIVQFVTINKEAKGVPTSLYYDLLNRLPHNKTPAEKSKEIATEIARTLTISSIVNVPNSVLVNEKTVSKEFIAAPKPKVPKKRKFLVVNCSGKTIFKAVK